jgi:hypothetical protein
MKDIIKRFFGCCIKVPSEDEYISQIDEEFAKKITPDISKVSSEKPEIGSLSLKDTSKQITKRSKSGSKSKSSDNNNAISTSNRKKNSDITTTTISNDAALSKESSTDEPSSNSLSSSREDGKYVKVNDRCISPIREIIIDSYTQSK